MKNTQDLSGQRFGKLVALEVAGTNAKGMTLWKCACDCGSEKIVRVYALLDGSMRSCRCGIAEAQRAAQTTHGGSKTRLFRTWHGMRQRCGNPRANRFDRYGGRGIKVCEAWNTFATFRDWALANGYTDHLTIERIDGDGNYEPGNCTWATQAAQVSNRPNVKRSPDGRPAWQVAEENGISAKAYHFRVAHGWSVEEAITRPVGLGKRRRKSVSVA